MQSTRLLFGVCFVLGCSGAKDPETSEVRPVSSSAGTPSTSGSQRPAWIDKRITEFQNAPVANPPRAIWRCEYKNSVVYYFPPPCCDQYGQLFTAEGTLLCAPDGGLTGHGDGTCNDFFALRKNVSLVWQDARSYPAAQAVKSAPVH